MGIVNAFLCVYFTPKYFKVVGILNANRFDTLDKMDKFLHDKSFQSCPTLCNPMDHSLLGSSVQRISQARILECIAISFLRDFLDPGWNPHLISTALAGGFFFNH